VVFSVCNVLGLHLDYGPHQTGAVYSFVRAGAPTGSKREDLRKLRITQPRGFRLTSAEPRSKGKIPTREGPYVEGVSVGPKERERRLANQRVDRSHRRRGGISRGRRRRRQSPLWTLGEKDALVLSLALIFAEVVLVVVFLLP